jgi:hypothetical protein
MFHPVLCCISSEGEIPELGNIHVVGQLKENTETRPGKKSMCRFGENMEAGNRCRIRDAI